MKKIRSIYTSYMIRPTIYMCVSRSGLALVLLLLWDRFINKGVYSVLRDGCMVVGMFLILVAWFSWLKLDGMSIPKIPFLNGDPEKRQRRFWGRADMVDFVDEHVVSFDELEDDEKAACVLVADLAAGLLFLVPGLIAMAMWYAQN